MRSHSSMDIKPASTAFLHLQNQKAKKRSSLLSPRTSIMIIDDDEQTTKQPKDIQRNQKSQEHNIEISENAKQVDEGKEVVNKKDEISRQKQDQGENAETEDKFTNHNFSVTPLQVENEGKEPTVIKIQQEESQLIENQNSPVNFYQHFLPRAVDKFRDYNDGEEDELFVDKRAKKVRNEQKKISKKDSPTQTIDLQGIMEIQENQYFIVKDSPENLPIKTKCLQYKNIYPTKKLISKPRKKRSSKLHKNVLSTLEQANVSVKVLSQTQDQYQKSRIYLKKDYWFHNKKDNQMSEEDLMEIKSQTDSYQSIDELEDMRKKLGFLKKINDKIKQIEYQKRLDGRQFIPAPEHKLTPKKIYEYPPVSMVPQAGKFAWPPPMSHDRLWRKQMHESRKLT